METRQECSAKPGEDQGCIVSVEGEGTTTREETDIQRLKISEGEWQRSSPEPTRQREEWH